MNNAWCRTLLNYTGTFIRSASIPNHTFAVVWDSTHIWLTANTTMNDAKQRAEFRSIIGGEIGHQLWLRRRGWRGEENICRIQRRHKAKIRLRLDFLLLFRLIFFFLFVSWPMNRCDILWVSAYIVIRTQIYIKQRMKPPNSITPNENAQSITYSK